jgi:hypothetical protein
MTIQFYKGVSGQNHLGEASSLHFIPIKYSMFYGVFLEIGQF